MRLFPLLPASAMSAAASTAHAPRAAPEIEAGRHPSADPHTRSITTAAAEFVRGSERVDDGDGTATIRHDADPHRRVEPTASCGPGDRAWGEARDGGVVEAR